MEIKWMSRDKGSNTVWFWSEEPHRENGDSRFYGTGGQDHVPARFIANAPEPGTCVPVESFKPIEVTVKQDKYWLYRTSSGCAYYVYRHGVNPVPHAFGEARVIASSLGEEVASLILPNHNLQPGQCIEIPPR